MTTVEKQSPPNPADDDVYHSDDVGLRDTPPPGPMSVNLQPAPSPPPAVPLPPVSPDSTPDPPNRRASDRQKSQPSQADGVLASYMGDGRWPDILHRSPLPPDEEEEGSVKGLEVSLKEEAAEKKDIVDHVGQLAAIATSALEHERQAIPERLEPAQATSTTRAIAPDLNGHPTDGEPMEDAKPTIPSITASYVGAPRPQPSPDATVKTEIMTSPAGELPPIRQHSPKSGLSNGNGAGSITLPSISAHLRDLNHFPETAATGDSTFSQSPPTRAPRFQAVPGQGSPPKSPNDAFFRELPSPGRAAGSYYNNPNNHQKPSQADVSPYASAGDYSSGNIETLSKNLSIEQPGSIPAMAIDRMSIDGITNPQVGGYQCTYPGCTAQPFQTQVSIHPPPAYTASFQNLMQD